MPSLSHFTERERFGRQRGRERIGKRVAVELGRAWGGLGIRPHSLAPKRGSCVCLFHCVPFYARARAHSPRLGYLVGLARAPAQRREDHTAAFTIGHRRNADAPEQFVVRLLFVSSALLDVCMPVDVWMYVHVGCRAVRCVQTEPAHAITQTE